MAVMRGGNSRRSCADASTKTNRLSNRRQVPASSRKFPQKTLARLLVFVSGPVLLIGAITNRMKPDQHDDQPDLIPAPANDNAELIPATPDEARVISYPSVIYDMPAAAYHLRPEISSHNLGDIRQAPAIYAWKRNHPEDPTPSMRFGTLFHLAVLEPELFEAETILLPDDAPSRPTSRQRNAKKPSPDTVAACLWWDGFEVEAIGKEIVTPDEFEKLSAMAAAVRAHPAASALLALVGATEPSLFWIDQETGQPLRCRMDRLIPTKRLILDLKTTNDASPEGFAKSVANFGYHRQAAFYTDAANLLADTDGYQFAFIAVEKEPPFLVGVYTLTPEAIAQGRVENREALATADACLRSGNWPGYSDSVVGLDLPRWAQVMPADA